MAKINGKKYEVKSQHVRNVVVSHINVEKLSEEKV
jgi:hypothetical protein